MNVIHVTANGKRMFISQMDSKHLDNTIKMLIKNIGGLKAALSCEVAVTDFKAAIYGIKKTDIAEEAKGKVSYLSEKLAPYLAEAMLRGMVYTEELQELFERKEQESLFSVEPLQIERSCDWEDVMDNF